MVWRDYGNHAMPGQTKKTVGYLVDEGKILGPLKPVNLAGKEYEGIKKQEEINAVANHKQTNSMLQKYMYY